MRIISDTKDYYDCNQRMDQDRDLLLVRKAKEVRIPKDKLWPFPRTYPHYCSSLGLEDHVVGFCGKIYPVLCVRYSRMRNGSPANAMEFCISLDEVDHFAELHLKKREFDEYIKGGKGSITSVRKDVETFFSLCKQQQNAFTAHFEQHQCPVFHAASYERVITYNTSRLKDIHFFRVFDTYQAYQEIRMYLSNIAAPDKPLPVLNDADLINSHGFDKFSFRKPKSR